jgi:3-dehydrosphinganine reductase
MKKALIVGVGEATGASVCRNLAPDHQVGLVARSEGCIGALARELSHCEAFRCDVSDTFAWGQTLDAIEAAIGIPQRIVFNTEGGGWGAYDQINMAAFTESFAVNVSSLLLLAQKWFPKVVASGDPLHLIINSSHAAQSPSPNFTGLGPSRAAQHNLAQALLQTVDQSAIAIKTLIIGGPIDEPKLRKMLPKSPASEFIAPDSIAEKIRSMFETMVEPSEFADEIRPPHQSKH